MNGIHDMGGMQDMGPLKYEKDEPVFHADWERRIFAMVWATDTPPGGRYETEIIPPAEYLRMSYYEQWLTSFVSLMLKHGMITQAELDTGKPVPGTRKGELMTAAQVPAELVKSDSAIRNLPIATRFNIGQKVRVRNLNPVTHTRQPRYSRGNSAPSNVITVSSILRTPPRGSSARTLSMFIPYASPRANYGAPRPISMISFTWICGMSTLNQPDAMARPERT